MFPFDLPGPRFLLFYAIFGVLLILGLRLWQRAAEGGAVPKVPFDDPYLIACLRGGPEEAIRVAAATLLDRGHIERDAVRLVTRPGTRETVVQRKLERAIVKRLALPMDAAVLPTDVTLQGACSDYEAALIARKLIPDDAQRAARRFRVVVGIAVLAAVALVKIGVAFAAGRRNVAFLIILAALFCGFAYLVLRSRRTALGDRLLRDMERLFARLKTRASSLVPGIATPDAALLMAVFGVGALPPAFVDIRALLARQPTTGDSGSGGCSSSSGSCSSGCGGGGGCGGCGGS